MLTAQRAQASQEVALRVGKQFSFWLFVFVSKIRHYFPRPVARMFKPNFPNRHVASKQTEALLVTATLLKGTGSNKKKQKGAHQLDNVVSILFKKIETVTITDVYSPPAHDFAVGDSVLGARKVTSFGVKVLFKWVKNK